MKRPLLVFLFALLVLPAARSADFATQLMEATFKFYDPDSTSTCMLVKRGQDDPAIYLVTTAHTLERTKHDTAILVLRELQADGSYKRLDHTLVLRKDKKEQWVRHEKQDVAVLKLTAALPIAVQALPDSALLDEAGLRASGVHLCSPIYLLTYPQRFEANGAGFPVARSGIVSSPLTLPLATHPTFLGDFITFAGDSGGPVFIEGPGSKPLVLGIVLAQNYHDEQVKTEYTETLMHHPLNIGTVLHAGSVREALGKAAAVKSGGE